jgi:hypothetical protein
MSPLSQLRTSIFRHLYARGNTIIFCSVEQMQTFILEVNTRTGKQAPLAPQQRAHQ